jgi:hypothetical protein
VLTCPIEERRIRSSNSDTHGKELSHNSKKSNATVEPIEPVNPMISRAASDILDSDSGEMIYGVSADKKKY